MYNLLPFPLQSMLWDLDNCIKAKLYYPAMLLALTLPEICSALALPKTRFVKEADYSSFVDKYSTPAGLGLNGKECYRLRGGVVHRASFNGHPHFGADAVIFTVPESRSSIHAMTLQAGDKSAAMFDLISFCEAMKKAVWAWYLDHSADQQVEENLKNLIAYRPDGLVPFVAGVPVISSG